MFVKHCYCFVLIILGIQLSLVISQSTINDIYGFKAVDIDGYLVSFDQYKNTVLMVVNVASNCGLTTSNYEQMNDLFDKYSSKGFRIAAFPSNQFNQEPGDNKAIKTFTKQKNVKFDVFAKIDINGDNTHPIFKWLKHKLPGVLSTEMIKWNFTKFLISCNGVPFNRYSPLTNPNDIKSDIEAELAKCKKNDDSDSSPSPTEL